VDWERHALSFVREEEARVTTRTVRWCIGLGDLRGSGGDTQFVWGGGNVRTWFVKGICINTTYGQNKVKKNEIFYGPGLGGGNEVRSQNRGLETIS
jgi:hypothetical protein